MTLNYDFSAVCLPYCLKKQEDNTFLVLNRNYKPLSFKSIEDDFLKQELPIYLKIRGLTERKIHQIISIGEGACVQNDGKDIFLYNDKTNPLYNERRAIILKG
jgi:hypothetical protein